MLRVVKTWEFKTIEKHVNKCQTTCKMFNEFDWINTRTETKKDCRKSTLINLKNFALANHAPIKPEAIWHKK